MKTIYYLSNVKWYSHTKGYRTKQEALRKHIKYVINSKDFRFAVGDAKYVIENSRNADKRVNSRIACSFVFAIPNNLSDNEIKKIMIDIRKEIAKFNNMEEKNIFIGFHDSRSMFNNENKHLHIVLVNLDQNGKSIRLGRSRNEIQYFHNMMQTFLVNNGYGIRRSKEENKIEHIGMKLRYNQELQQLYQEYLSTKQEIKFVLTETKKKGVTNRIDEEEKIRKIREAERMLKGEVTEEEDIIKENIMNDESSYLSL